MSQPNREHQAALRLAGEASDRARARRWPLRLPRYENLRRELLDSRANPLSACLCVLATFLGRSLQLLIASRIRCLEKDDPFQFGVLHKLAGRERCRSAVDVTDPRRLVCDGSAAEASAAISLAFSHTVPVLPARPPLKTALRRDVPPAQHQARQRFEYD
jgi:hypothetical protein